MLYLIKKELTANVRYLLYGLAFFVIYAFIFASNGDALFMMCYVFFFYMLATTNMVLDERYKIDLLTSTLPIRRRDVVLSKYLLLIVVFVICFVLYTLLAAVSRAAGFDRLPPLNLVSVALGFFAVSIFNGVMIPLSYRFGAQATRYIYLILFFAVFILSSMLGSLDIPNRTLFTQYAGTVGLGLILLVAAVVISLVSYLIARRVYENKDF